MSDSGATFADTLRRAIEQRGLSLDRIHARLHDRGVGVSVATLSYWKSGRSQPGRRSSLTTLPHLEDVLGLQRGELARVLPAVRERPRRKAVRDLGTLWSDPSPAAVLARLDTTWDTELDRIMLHDRLRLGSDRRHLGLTVRQAMRARCDGPDRRVLLHQQDDPAVPLPELRVLRGARVGRVEREEAGGVVGAELHFCQPLRRGETVVVEYELAWAGNGPLDVEYTRRLRTPLRELLIEVEFHPQARPDAVTAFTHERESLVGLDVEHRATVVHPDNTPGTAGLRWDWPEAAEHLS
ncbi:helix-turn-helix domain-containing protein [Knoellia sp. CPCC 206435]|uniref:helix-turn-helix domain-containing protein n=1 Tax=Knoellia terrae TaxID=3404797 RepID=UPI003B42AD4F